MRNLATWSEAAGDGGEVQKSNAASAVCVCLIMCNTWTGPKADVSSEAVSQLIKMVTVASH